MRKVFVVLVIIAMIPVLTSCRPFYATKGTAKGVGSVGEGVARGTMEAGKGSGGLVGGSVQATGEALTGRGDEALDTAKDAFEAGGEGLKGAVEETFKGIETGLKHIDKGITQASENIK